MGRITWGQIRKQSLLFAVLVLGAAACGDSGESSDSDESSPAVATPTPPGVLAGEPLAVISIGTANAAPGGSVTVELIVTPLEGVTVGALDVDIVYDSAVLEATDCTPAGCNPTVAGNTLRFSMASLEGFSSATGSATFKAVGAVGASSVLEVRVLACANVEAELIACDATDGSITIASQ